MAVIKAKSYKKNKTIFIKKKNKKEQKRTKKSRKERRKNNNKRLKERQRSKDTIRVNYRKKE